MLSYLKSVFTTGDRDGELVSEYKVTMSIPLVKSELESKYLSKCLNITKPKDVTLDEILKFSAEFPVKFPLESVRCSVLKDQSDITSETLEHHANSAYPLLHEATIPLYVEFLEFKKHHGSTVERALYADMNLIDLIQRILNKRAVTFFGPRDRYLLLSGESGMGGWELVGTDDEVPPLVLEKCLSYDEIKLSALLAFTSYSVFTNDGNRYNRGSTSVNASGEIERNGIVIGLVGPCFPARGIIDDQEILIAEKQNTVENGYGTLNDGPKYEWHQIWSKFYGVKNLPLFDEIKSARMSTKNESVRARYVKLYDEMLFDNEIYAKRISVAAELLLLEAESRAAEAGKSAFIQVVGLGLGSWRISKHQDKIYLDTFAKCLKDLNKVLLHVSDINFAWFQEKSFGGVKDGGLIGDSDRKIKIHFSDNPPHSHLNDSSKLLIVTYAWNGNSLPGNDFWINHLDSSGDPANACSTQVAELQNPHVNRKISATNLHVASSEWGIVHIAEYARRKLDSQTANEGCEMKE